MSGRQPAHARWVEVSGNNCKICQKFKNILTDRLKADWQGNMALFYFLIPGLPALPGERSEIFLIYPARPARHRFSFIFLSDLRAGWTNRILSGVSRAGGGSSKSFWSLFYWWDLVGNNTGTQCIKRDPRYFPFCWNKRGIFWDKHPEQLLTSPELISFLIDA